MTTPIFERRDLFEPVEFRGEEDGRKLYASGVAVRYNAISRDLGGYVEQVKPTAAKKTIKERDIVALVNHDPNKLLGRTSSGTLRLANDAEALRYEITLPDTTVGRDAAVLLERRDIVGSSFGFRNVVPPAWTKTEDGRALRTLQEISIRDLGPVTFPAYDSSSAEVALRSLAETTGYELRTLIEAADHGSLADFVDPPPAEEERDEEETQEEQRTEDDGREAPTVRTSPRMSWLYC